MRTELQEEERRMVPRGTRGTHTLSPDSTGAREVGRSCYELEHRWKQELEGGLKSGGETYMSKPFGPGAHF